MNKKFSRKEFLSGTFKGVLSAGVSTVALPATLKASGEGELATLIDIRKCIGCNSCVYECQGTNYNHHPEPQKPFPNSFPSKVKVSDWSEKSDVIDRLTPYNWLYIQKAEVSIGGEKKTLNVPRRCMHCQDPPCVNLCPFGAAHKHENGTSIIDDDVCLGGAKCKKVCPWDIPERQSGVGVYLDLVPEFVGNGVMYKCNRCHDKVAKGKIPACIEVCPQGVQKIGPRNEIIEEAHAIAKEIDGYIYGEKENGGTNTIYISPVPFEELNRVVEKGDGQPHFDNVDDTMAKTEALSKAFLLAPFAGIAGAFLKFYKKIKDDKIVRGVVDEIK